jgi:uncharacterized protein
MLIELAISNFRSIRDRQVLTFRAEGNVGKKTLPDNLIVPTQKSHGEALIKTAVFYGANASGKSNFLWAFNILQTMVVESKAYQLDKPIDAYKPYKLDKTSYQAQTTFEIEFVAKDGIRYRYEVSYDKLNILKEDLYFYPNARNTVRKSLLFSRKRTGKIEAGEHYRGKQDFEVNPNQLILSHAGIAHPMIVEAYRFFSNYLFYAPAQSATFDETMLNMAEHYLSMEDNSLKKAIVSIVSAGDIGISDVFIQKLDDKKMKILDGMSDEDKQKVIHLFRNRIKTVHPIYEGGTLVEERVFDLSEESTGTIKLLGLAGFIVDALQDGSSVIVDEMDKNLHPLLSRMLIDMFQNPEMNPHNAQLLFSTHDVNLMDRDLFRRDQIFIIDKNTEGVSTVKRLSDFTGISKVIPLQKWYMLGMFKGIPAINSYEINLNLAQQHG